MEAKSGKETLVALRTPLVIDAALLLLIVFQGGIVFNKVSTLTDTVEQIQADLKAVPVPPATIDRLARIETKLDRVTIDVKELSEQVIATRHGR